MWYCLTDWLAGWLVAGWLSFIDFWVVGWVGQSVSHSLSGSFDAFAVCFLFSSQSENLKQANLKIKISFYLLSSKVNCYDSVIFSPDGHLSKFIWRCLFRGRERQVSSVFYICTFYRVALCTGLPACRIEQCLSGKLLHLYLDRMLYLRNFRDTNMNALRSSDGNQASLCWCSEIFYRLYNYLRATPNVGLSAYNMYLTGSGGGIESKM